MGMCLMKNIMANNKSEHVAAATNSNSIFKQSDDLVEDLPKGLSNFNTLTEFRKKDVNAEKLR